MNSQPIILASTSIYRSQLLATLQLKFQTAAPEVDETPLANESALQTSQRLSQIKAQAVAEQYPDALIIGSDQVALLNDQQLGKPMTHDNAVRQLRAMRGNRVIFYTAVSLLNARTADMQTALVTTQVDFRQVSDDEIERYLLKEQPYHCAGSAKSEGLGIALIQRIQGDDPNALIGLPLIKLVDMLKKQGVSIL
ncbi:MAG: septum formation inhibitor Maf [Sideroxydans sp.]|nr:septum formation inhibitor Maf [Sideroxydans sp.]NOT98312.1 septum formation inhibitor Maf [Sideroxydans sp.]